MGDGLFWKAQTGRNQLYQPETEIYYPCANPNPGLQQRDHFNAEITKPNLYANPFNFTVLVMHFVGLPFYYFQWLGIKTVKGSLLYQRQLVLVLN